MCMRMHAASRGSNDVRPVRCGEFEFRAAGGDSPEATMHRARLLDLYTRDLSLQEPWRLRQSGNCSLFQMIGCTCAETR
jgi:hypothetical protein